MSYPGTGSTGDGYAFARQAGHTIVPLRPGLTALESDEPFIKDLQGLTLQNVELSILIDGRKAASGRGELLFTHFGVSGPRLLVLSGTASDALQEPGRKVELSVNLKPELGEEALNAEIQGYFSANGARMFATYVKASLPGSLATRRRLLTTSLRLACSERGMSGFKISSSATKFAKPGSPLEAIAAITPQVAAAAVLRLLDTPRGPDR